MALKRPERRLSILIRFSAVVFIFKIDVSYPRRAAFGPALLGAPLTDRSAA